MGLPGGPVVKTTGVISLILGQGTKIPSAAWHSHKENKNYKLTGFTPDKVIPHSLKKSYIPQP